MPLYFLCRRVGAITVSNLKKRLGVFFPDLSAKEYRFMMNNKKELAIEDLHEMLDNNDISNFDPVEEAFKLYDVENEGYINKLRLREIFEAYGFDGMTTEDCQEVEIIGWIYQFYISKYNVCFK